MVIENTAQYYEVPLDRWTISTDEGELIPVPDRRLRPQSKIKLHEIELGISKPSTLLLRNSEGIIVANSEYSDNRYIPQGYIG